MMVSTRVVFVGLGKFAEYKIAFLRCATPAAELDSLAADRGPVALHETRSRSSL
jgi:hypothetical protein